MTRLNEFIERRQQIAAHYDELLENIPVTPQSRPEDCYSGMHLYVIRLQTDNLIRSHKQIFTELREVCIGVNLHYIALHFQPWYQAMGFKQGDYPHAEQYYNEAISLPMFPDLQDTQVEAIVNKLKNILR